MSPQGRPHRGHALLFMARPRGGGGSDGRDFSTGRLSSTSSNSSCGSSEYSGEVIPHPPGKCHPSWLGAVGGILLPALPVQIVLEVTQPLLWDETGVVVGQPGLH